MSGNAKIVQNCTSDEPIIYIIPLTKQNQHRCFTAFTFNSYIPSMASAYTKRSHSAILVSDQYSRETLGIHSSYKSLCIVKLHRTTLNTQESLNTMHPVFHQKPTNIALGRDIHLNDAKQQLLVPLVMKNLPTCPVSLIFLPQRGREL